MRSVWLLAVLLLGCIQSIDSLADRGAVSLDAAAPPPRSYNPETFVMLGDANVAVRVLDHRGLPVADATVCVERINLRSPVDNYQTYIDDRLMTAVLTDRAGKFAIYSVDRVLHISVEAPGFRAYRAPLSAVDETMEIRLSANGAPLIMAHRGASFYAPENTIKSFHKAIELGANAIEADVRLTSDRQLVIMHDETVNRPTGGSGAVAQMHSTILRRLDAGAWFDDSFAAAPEPALVEFITAARDNDIHLMLDVKAPEDLREETWIRVLNAVDQMQAHEFVSFATFGERSMRECSGRPGMVCTWLRQNTTAPLPWLDRATMAGVDWVSVSGEIASQEFVDRAHQLGLLVQVWTLNSPGEWQIVMDYGVDAITTDRMGYLVDYVNGLAVPYEP